MIKKSILFAMAALLIAAIIIAIKVNRPIVMDDIKPVSFFMPTGGDFSIPSTEGEFTTIGARGKTLFVFFGFTHCPHICPTTLMNLRTMLHQIPEPYKDKVQVLFISVDTERDTMDVIKQKIAAYKTPNMIGATDTDNNLRKITQLFGATYSRWKAKDGTPLVDHTSDVFVINDRGEWVDRVAFDALPEEFMHAFEIASDKRPIIETLHPLKELPEIGRNSTCDLSLQSCDISVDQQQFTLTLTPQPVRQRQSVHITVKTSSSEWTPLLIDMVGIDQNMSFLRPTLSKQTDAEFTGDVSIPICEVQHMRWNVRLVIYNKENTLSVLTYFLKTEI